jgi:hypothetical protein
MLSESADGPNDARPFGMPDPDDMLPEMDAAPPDPERGDYVDAMPERSLRARLGEVFNKVRIVKPPASRGESAETYVVARGLRAL